MSIIDTDKKLAIDYMSEENNHENTFVFFRDDFASEMMARKVGHAKHNCKKKVTVTMHLCCCKL